jgi:hypothetical protein
MPCAEELQPIEITLDVMSSNGGSDTFSKVERSL